MRLLLAAVLCSLAVPAFAQQKEQDDSQQVAQKMLEAWNKAVLAKDATGLAALYAEDAVQVTTQGVFSGRPSIEHAYAGMFKDVTFEASQVSHSIPIGKDVILRDGTWRATYKGPNGPVKLRGYWSDVDVRFGDTWKIRHETSNTAAPATAD